VKTVVGTNILATGLLSPFGSPMEIVRMIASGTLRLCFDARILTGYGEVLARPKFQFSFELTQALIEQIKTEGLSVAGNPLPARLPDPTDEPFLETAIAGDADCLITGNIKHFPSAKRQGAVVISPSEFLEYFRKQTRSR
jgi:putative PIN family toxin of toxin-antitoxin system